MAKPRTPKTEYISKKIIEMRKSVGCSQAELGRNVAVTSAAISQLEKGDRMPSLLVASKLAAAFHISIEELIGQAAPSSLAINQKAQVFFRKFGELDTLTTRDQKLITEIIKRLQEKNGNE